MNWIKCSEQMPKENQLVLGWAIRGRGYDYPYMAICSWLYVDNNICWIPFPDGTRFEVSHWIPLPEKPE